VGSYVAITDRIGRRIAGVAVVGEDASELVVTVPSRMRRRLVTLLRAGPYTGSAFRERTRSRKGPSSSRV
jgi:hypothetical protein